MTISTSAGKKTMYVIELAIAIFIVATFPEKRIVRGIAICTSAAPPPISREFGVAFPRVASFAYCSHLVEFDGLLTPYA